VAGARRPRWLFVLCFVAWIAVSILYYGSAARALLGAAGLLCVLTFSEDFAPDMRPAWRGYLQVAAGSAFLGLLLFSLAFNLLFLILWAAVTGFGFFWFWYWGRTEPLPPEL
jgi:hypothetical protein